MLSQQVIWRYRKQVNKPLWGRQITCLCNFTEFHLTVVSTTFVFVNINVKSRADSSPMHSLIWNNK
jgi:hypothetical protein